MIFSYYVDVSFSTEILSDDPETGAEKFQGPGS